MAGHPTQPGTRRSTTRPPPIVAPAFEVGDQVGGYRLDHKLAEGGMSVVYAAHHCFLDREVAIKIAAREPEGDTARSRERFLREAQILTRLAHRGVAGVHDFGYLEDGRPWIALDLLHGRTLAEILERELVDPARAVLWLRQVAQTLAAAHRLGVVHRDLKPDNIFVGDDEHVHVLDWGIAFEPPQGNPRLTVGRLLIGTPTYLAPEQARGLDVDGKTDVYSLGVVAYEVFSHRLPFTGPSDIDVAAQHVMNDPPPLSDVWPDSPPRLEGLIMCMLAKDPDRRPDIDEVDRELAAISGLLRS